MSPVARRYCNDAVQQIYTGRPDLAVQYLRRALQQTHNRRAWSKLMLAIRELNRLLPAA